MKNQNSRDLFIVHKILITSIFYFLTALILGGTGLEPVDLLNVNQAR